MLDQTAGLIYELQDTGDAILLNACRPSAPRDPIAVRRLPFHYIRGDNELVVAATIGRKLYLYATGTNWKQMLRLETDAFDPDASASQPADDDEIRLSRLEYTLRPAMDGQSMLLLQGCLLYELSADGGKLVSRRRLPAMYRTFHERKDYYVALGVQSVDLLDKKTLDVKKRIDLPLPMPSQMVASPDGRTSFVGILQKARSIGTTEQVSSGVLEVNEQSGATTVLKDWRPTSLMMSQAATD